jgi:AmmeMemoRadiSam system protein A
MAVETVDRTRQNQQSQDQQSQQERLTDAQRAKLVELAVASITRGVHYDEPLHLRDAELEGYLAEPRATFVTVYLDGELAGCIGSLEARRPLGRDIAHNAYMAAFRDPRFDPLSADDLERLSLHISVLSPLRELDVTSEADLVAALEPGVHGLVLTCHGQRGTLLPSVWDQCPDPALFVRHVKRKAGLPQDYWSDEMRALVYEVDEFDGS